MEHQEPSSSGIADEKKPVKSILKKTSAIPPASIPISLSSGSSSTKPKPKPKQPVKKQPVPPPKPAAEHPKKENEGQPADIKWRKVVDGAILQTQQKMLSTPVTKPFLDQCALIFQPIHYSEVVSERSANHRCGLPTCSNPLPSSQSNAQFRISLKQLRVYDMTERRDFCSDDCLMASRLYQSTLSEEPSYARPASEQLVKEMFPTVTDKMVDKLKGAIMLGEAAPVDLAISLQVKEKAVAEPPSKDFFMDIDNDAAATMIEGHYTLTPGLKSSSSSFSSSSYKSSSSTSSSAFASALFKRPAALSSSSSSKLASISLSSPVPVFNYGQEEETLPSPSPVVEVEKRKVDGISSSPVQQLEEKKTVEKEMEAEPAKPAVVIAPSSSRSAPVPKRRVVRRPTPASIAGPKPTVSEAFSVMYQVKREQALQDKLMAQKKLEEDEKMHGKKAQQEEQDEQEEALQLVDDGTDEEEAADDEAMEYDCDGRLVKRGHVVDEVLEQEKDRNYKEESDEDDEEDEDDGWDDDEDFLDDGIEADEEEYKRAQEEERRRIEEYMGIPLSKRSAVASSSASASASSAAPAPVVVQSPSSTAPIPGLQLSLFTQLWHAISNWTTEETVAYLQPAPQAASDADSKADSAPEVASRRPTPDATELQRLRVFSESMTRVASQVTSMLRIDFPLHLECVHLANTFSFARPLPAMQNNHWKIMCCLFLRALCPKYPKLASQILAQGKEMNALLESLNFRRDELEVCCNTLQKGS